ncbi:MAG: septum formation protein Maf, partial [Chloroflexi bacterium]|nr:septum formation protein Maf [Chloroflexota bacterium]
MTSTFILASGSPRRRELLASLGIDFTIMKPDINEDQHPGENPYDHVRRLSVEKAAAVAARLDSADTPGAVILAADTVVILSADTIGVIDGDDGTILGKPTDADEARAMLRRLREQKHHQVCTAITLIKRADDQQTQLTRLTHTRVTLRAYTDAEIEAYIESGDPFDKAGSYSIQH